MADNAIQSTTVLQDVAQLTPAQAQAVLLQALPSICRCGASASALEYAGLLASRAGCPDVAAVLLSRRDAAAGAVAVGSTDATQAGHQAEMLTSDMLELKKAIEVQANYDKIVAADPTFVPSYEQLLQSYLRFLQHASGKDIAWWNFPKQMNRNLWLIFEGTDLYNMVVEYRTKFNGFYAKAQQLLGFQPTPVAPVAPKARKVDRSPSEAMGAALDTLVKGVLLIGGVVGGGFLVLRLAGK